MEWAEAKELGLTRFNTGRPCKRGHNSERFTSSYTCCECFFLRRKSLPTDHDRGQEAIDRRKASIAEKQRDGRHNHHKQKWVDEHPEKRKAINAANNAVRDGKLKREPCEGCGTEVNVCKHHDDYNKPLEVRWLCSKCHHAHHKDIR